MDYLSLAIKNLMRRKVRTLLTLLGIGVAIAVLYSLQEFQRGYEQGLQNEMNQLGAHIMVVPKGCPYEAATILLHGGKWPRYMEEGYLDQIKAVRQVSQAAPVLMDAIINPATRDNKIFLGITAEYGKLRSKWRMAGPGFSGPEAREVILGTSIAEKLGLKVGDTFLLRQDEGGRAAGKDDADLKVVGTLERTGTQDDGFIFMPLHTLQDIAKLPGKIVVVLVRAERIDSPTIEQVTRDMRALGGNMNIFPLSELLNNAAQLMEVTRVFVLAIVVVAIAIGAVGVLNTILMTVFERTKEIGMMKAIGASSRDILALIWTETVLLCTAGGVVGIVIAVVSAHGVEWFLRKVLASQFSALPETTLIGLSPSVIAYCFALSVGLGVLAGFYPAWRASTVKPIEAIRGAN
jgi:putative ABC transport system permease protein